MTLEEPGRPDDAETLFAAWALRAESGDPASFEGLLAAHPEHAAALTALHADWQLFAPLLGRAVPGRIHESAGIVLAPISGAEDSDPAAPSPELLARLGIQMPEAGRYRFRAVIGRGGGGVVLKVWDAKLNRALAMKVVLGRGEERPAGDTPRIDGRTLSRFVDEARIASQLNHPCIVPVHELGADEAGRAYFTMKLVKGEDLARIFEHVKTGHDGWNPTRVLSVLLRVCESVAFAHEKGVIHRDLKPANVMVGRHGEVYVMDWGLARVLGEEDKRDVRVRPPPATSALLTVRSGPPDRGADSPLYTMDGDVVGTPAYMAPEQAAGRLDQMGPHSDVYAVGAMIYHLLAGHMPYVPDGARVNNYAVWQRVQEGSPSAIEILAPKAPLELIATCEKAMAREIPRRYADMHALASDLRAYLEGRVVSAYETGTWAETRNWVKRHRALAASSAVACVATLLGSAAFKLKADEARTHAEQAQWNAYVAAISVASGARSIGEPATVQRMLESAPPEHRGWEWNYLDAITDSSLFGQGGCEGAMSPNGLLIATLCPSGTIRISSTETGALVRSLSGQPTDWISWGFTEDGSTLSAFSRGEFVAWDVATLNEIVRLDDERCRPIKWADYHVGRARILVVPESDNPLTLWDSRSGELISDLESGLRGEKDSNSNCSASFSSDGTRVLVKWRDAPPHLFSADTGKPVSLLDGHRGAVNVAAFSADGNLVTTASDDERVNVWDVSTGENIMSFPVPSGEVHTVRFGRRSTLLATVVLEESEDASSMQSLQVWSLETGELIHRIVWNDTGQRSSLDEVVFSPSDSTVLAWRHFGGVPHVWSTSSGELVATLRGWDGVVQDAEFSPDGSTIAMACADGKIRLWMAEGVGQLPFAELEGHRANRVIAVYFTPDGSRLFSVAEGEAGSYQEWKVWELSRPWMPWNHHNIHGWAAFLTSADDGAAFTQVLKDDGHWAILQVDVLNHREVGRFLDPLGRYATDLEITDSRLLASLAGAATYVWDRRTGVPVGVIDNYTLPERHAGTTCTDGKRVVLKAQGLGVSVFDIETGEQLVTLVDSLSDDIGAIGFDPTGTRVFESGHGWGRRSPRVWNAQTGEIEARLAANEDMVTAVKFSEDGEQVVTVGLGGGAVLWRTQDWTQVAGMGGGEALLDAAFSADGSLVAVSSIDGTAQLWDPSAGGDIRWLEGHTDSVDRVSFSPDGNLVATASRDLTIRVWDVRTGSELIRQPAIEAEDAISLNWSRDGEKLILASAFQDKKVLDSVPRRVRIAAHRAARNAKQAGEAALEEALALKGDIVDAGEWLAGQRGVGPDIKQAALDGLLEYAQAGRVNAHDLEATKRRVAWMRSFLESEANNPKANQDTDETSPDGIDFDKQIRRAWYIVNPDDPWPEEAPAALEHARSAISKLDIDALPSSRAYCHELQAWALFWLRRFDEARVEAEAAIEMDPDRASLLERMDLELRNLGYCSGKVSEQAARDEIARLERRIAELESDRWVQAWIEAHERRRR